MPTSTALPSTPRAPRKRLALALQLAFAAAVVIFAGVALRRQWRDAEQRVLALDPDWVLIVAATVVMLVTYVLLIQLWILLMAGWSAKDHRGTAAMTFLEAARIWFVSGLGKYIPGKVWALTMMGVLARRAGISPVVATASSVIAGLLSIVTGMGLVMMLGLDTIAARYPRVTALGVLSLAVFVAVLLVTPVLLPWLARTLGRVMGREIVEPKLSRRAIWIATAGTAVSWVMYGVAFWLFSRGVMGSASGALTAWIAVYAASYLAGFLFVPAPGGIGIRETALTALMPMLGLATVPQAVVIAVTSRLWLTVLEILPALLLLRGSGLSITAPPRDIDAST